VLRDREISVPALFATNGRYAYRNGVNVNAMIALAAAIAPVIPGFVRAAATPGGQVPDPTLFDHVYTHAWFVTFGLSFVLYLTLMRGRGTTR
jgi:NCS1 family nucleobase:cation symporter-1